MFLAKLVCKERNYFSIGKDYTNSLSIVIHSDTLFSSICNNFRKIYGKKALESFIDQLVQSIQKARPKLKLSSGFHYIDIYKNREFFKTIYFLPRPLIKFPLSENSQNYLDQNLKNFKKVKFISLEVAKKLQKNETISLSQFHILDSMYLLDDKDLDSLGLKRYLVLLQKEDNKLRKQEREIKNRISIFEILDEQKVRINRIITEPDKAKSEPFTRSKFKFNISNYFIKEGDTTIDYDLYPGFYFLVDYVNIEEELISKINAAIRLIIDEGIGGKRSIGCGLVDDIESFEIDENFEYFDLIKNKNKGYFVNLSLVYPNLENIDKIEYFNIYGRSGFVFSAETTSKRFNDLKFVEEGGIFLEEIQGNLIQVASDEFVANNHKVYKNGIGFYVNIGNIKDEK